MAFKSVLSLLLIASTAFARPTPADNHADHSHSGRSLFEAFGIKEWAHPVDHPVTALFRRQNANNYTVGSAGKQHTFSYLPSHHWLPIAIKCAHALTLMMEGAHRWFPNIKYFQAPYFDFFFPYRYTYLKLINASPSLGFLFYRRAPHDHPRTT